MEDVTRTTRLFHPFSTLPHCQPPYGLYLATNSSAFRALKLVGFFAAWQRATLISNRLHDLHGSLVGWTAWIIYSMRAYLGRDQTVCQSASSKAGHLILGYLHQDCKLCTNALNIVSNFRVAVQTTTNLPKSSFSTVLACKGYYGSSKQIQVCVHQTVTYWC